MVKCIIIYNGNKQVVHDMYDDVTVIRRPLATSLRCITSQCGSMYNDNITLCVQYINLNDFMNDGLSLKLN